MTKQTSIKIPDEILPHIEKYRLQRGYKSLSAALLELAGIGINQVFDVEVSTPVWGRNKWGYPTKNNRKS